MESNQKRDTKNPYHDEKLFAPYHRKRSELILNGGIPSPSLIEIDPTDEGCNQSCVFCCFGSGSHKKVRQINVEMLLKFLAETYAHGTFAYELVGGGEPTNHAQIAAIVEGISKMATADKERPRIGLVTNGVRLDRVARVADKLDFVRIGFDAPNQQIYSLLHGVKESTHHFEKILSHATEFVKLIGKEKMRFGYLVVPPHNHCTEHILAASELAATIGVEHIAYRPAFGSPSASHEMWNEAADAILVAKKLYRPGFILGGEGGSWPYVTRVSNQPSGYCKSRPLVLVIKADGTVPSCFLYRERLKERPAIGHISEGFEKLWFSEKHRESLGAVNRLNCPSVCKLFRADRALESLRQNPAGNVDENEIDNIYFI